MSISIAARLLQMLFQPLRQPLLYGLQQHRHLAIAPSNQHHPLLLRYHRYTEDDVRAAFTKAEIARVAFIRHGHTSPAPIDYERKLTPLGRIQSLLAGSSYGRELYPYFSKALCSPAPRCTETAELFFDSASVALATTSTAEDVVQMPTLQLHKEMYDGTMQPAGSRLFKSIGYAPLRTYLENPVEEDATAAKIVFGEYAQNSLDLLWNAVQTSEDENNETNNKQGGKALTLLFFAHAIYLPAVALEFAMTVGCNHGVDFILDTNTKEAEGFLVRIDTKSASLLHRPYKE